MSDDDSDVPLAAAALAISMVALGATLLQLAQQYISTAAGFSKCGPHIMGDWGKSRKLRVQWKQFRVEVRFETPIIFVCEPNNTKYPVKDTKPYFVDGDGTQIETELRRRWERQTMLYFLLWGWTEYVFGKRRWKDWQDARDQQRDAVRTTGGGQGLLAEFWTKTDAIQSAILSTRWTATLSTADSSLTSWVRLYEDLQLMEKESGHWQLDTVHTTRKTPISYTTGSSSLTVTAHAMQSRTLMVALQPLERSWDTMPVDLTKPYATTTMSHMVEITAMLSIYWQVFDQTNDHYRAEGNGFLVVGEKHIGLGLTFSFNRYGKHRFKENRLIPADGIKDLCFGKVVTIYAETIDQRRLEPAEIENMAALQLSDVQEIVGTLRVIGCNTTTINVFLDKKRTSHLFPIVFEFIGMLGQTFHIDNTLFRFLPNPTKATWDRRAFSIREMLFAFESLLNTECTATSNPSPVKTAILRHMAVISPGLWRWQENKQSQAPEADFLNNLHHALDEMDVVLTIKKAPLKKGAPPTKPQTPTETPEQADRREMVRDVLKSHIQTVLFMLNKPEEDDSKFSRLSRGNISVEVPRRSSIPEFMLEGTTMQDLDSAPEEGDHNKNQMLMEIYFSNVRKVAVDEATGTTIARKKGRAVGPPDGAWLFDRVLERNEAIRRENTMRRGEEDESMTGIKRNGTDPIVAAPNDEMDRPKLQRTWTLPTQPSASGAGMFEKSISGLGHHHEQKHASSSRGTMLDKVMAAVTGGHDNRSRTESETKIPGHRMPEMDREVAKQSPSNLSPGTPLPHPLPSASPGNGLPRKVEEHAGSESIRMAHSDDRETDSEERQQETLPLSPSALTDVSHDDIWCALVFRMLCWLTLHDFHKKDLQLPNSQLLGSRLPVFIA